MTWTVSTPPAGTVIDPATLAYHLRLDSDLAATTDEQTYLAELLAAAIEYAEVSMQASLITRTITATYFDPDNYELTLPRGPVIAITSVTNGDGSPITTAKLQRRGNTDILILPNGWSEPLTVVYTAGCGTGYTATPPDIRQAIRAHVGSMYENRESAQDRPLYTVPHSLQDFYQRKCRVGILE